MDQELVDIGLNWFASCLYQCAIGEDLLDLTDYVANTWQTFEFALADLEGLDLTTLYTPLFCSPHGMCSLGSRFTFQM